LPFKEVNEWHHESFLPSVARTSRFSNLQNYDELLLPLFFLYRSSCITCRRWPCHCWEKVPFFRSCCCCCFRPRNGSSPSQSASAQWIAILVIIIKC